MADYMKFFRDAYAEGVGLADEQRVRLMQNAIHSYCEARMVLPISRAEYAQRGDPFKCGARWPLFSAGILFEAMDEGKPAEEAFDAAFGGEAADCVWRVMLKDERMKPGQLLAMMSEADRTQAMELLGTGYVIRTILADGGLHLMTARGIPTEGGDACGSVHG